MRRIVPVIAALLMVAAVVALPHSEEPPKEKVDYEGKYIKIDGVCAWNGKSYFVRNLNGDHWIEVRVDIKYFYQGTHRWSHQRFVVLRPAEKKEVGCTIHGSDRYAYTIGHVRWYDSSDADE